MPPGGDQRVSREREGGKEKEREKRASERESKTKSLSFLFGYELSNKCTFSTFKGKWLQKTSEVVKRLQIPPTAVEEAFYVLLTAL